MQFLDKGIIIMNERRERFIRVATRRTNAVLKKIAILSNCSNRNAYEYTDEEVNRIFNEIEKELRSARMKFRLRKSNKQKEFKL
jgi:hypothetical protein